MKICFHSWENLTDVFGEMGRMINSGTVNIVHVIYGPRENAKLKKVYSGKTYILLDFLHENWSLKPPQNLTEYVAEYNLPNIMELVYADRWIREYKDMETIERFVMLHILFWEQFFKNEHPDFLISESISGLSVYLAYLIGKKYNCIYLGVTHSRIPGKFYLAEEENGYSKKADYLYKKQPESLNIDEAQRFIAKFIREKTKPSYMIGQSKPPKIGNPLNIRAYLIRDPIDYFYTNSNLNPITAVIRKLLRKFRYFILSRFQNLFFKLPRDGEDFMLFPVHFQPEASTMVQSPFFENQVAVIENIARALPHNVWLYVKDHYAVLGSKELQFYRRIKKLPNVKLINPYVDSHVLIQKAKVVVTITGTPGWEAILYQRPVLVFGNVFYDTFPKVVKVTDFTKLPAVINELLNSNSGSFTESERNLLVASYLDSLYDGEFDVGRLPVTNHPQNIKNLCEGLMDYIKNYNLYQPGSLK